jgi:truncated hemoglobin YjbI
MSRPNRRAGDLAPDAEMWQALGNGELLRVILQDFYSRVFADSRLSQFFWQTTRERAIEKQYNFLHEVFTGQKVYFGERPYNAHSWMVIDHDLFDYREQLMVECLRRHGLPEKLVQRWRGLEESFRRHIVKLEPRGKKFGGVELPVEGYETMVLDCASLCDGCGDELPVGGTITYHVRVGHSFCQVCAPKALAGAFDPMSR